MSEDNSVEDDGVSRVEELEWRVNDLERSKVSKIDVVHGASLLYWVLLICAAAYVLVDEVAK